MADELSKESVVRRPRVIGFNLDPSVELLPEPQIKKKRKRTRDLLRLNLDAMPEDEAWSMFTARVNGL